MKRRLSIIGMLLAIAAEPAAAKECKGITFPEHTDVSGVSLTLNGLGLRKATLFRVSVYVAALYVARPSTDPGALIEAGSAAELILRFVRNVGAGDLRNAWDEDFARVAPRDAVLKDRITKLDGWMADLRTGDSLVFIRRPGAGIEVRINDSVRGTIDGDDFAKALLTIWLGPSPPNAELKSGLLGGACG